MAYIGKTPTVGNFQVCDAISVVNGQAAYTLQVGGVNVAPESANHMLVSLNGILQKPGSSFTISGSTMTFASNLATGDVIDFVQILGNVLDIGQPSDDTVTAAKLATTSITGQTAETSAADADTILIHDDSASALRKMTRSNFLSGIDNTPNFYVRGTANTSCADNTATKLSVGAEDWDSDSAFDLGSNNRFTIPSGKAGKYVFFARAYAPFTASVSFFEIRLYKNGSNIGGTASVHENYNTHLMTRSVDASAADYFELYVRQTGSSSAQNVQLYEFSGFRIST